MNLMDDTSLTLEAKRGLFVFFYAELLRHQGDINRIQCMLDDLSRDLSLTPKAKTYLEFKAYRYVHF